VRAFVAKAGGFIFFALMRFLHAHRNPLRSKTLWTNGKPGLQDGRALPGDLSIAFWIMDASRRAGITRGAQPGSIRRCGPKPSDKGFRRPKKSGGVAPPEDLGIEGAARAARAALL
jgi:hypothetical protein